MSAFLPRFEAIESRIASSYSCPRGTPGRVQGLRLRRCFQRSTRRPLASLGIQHAFDESSAHIYQEAKKAQHEAAAAWKGRALEQQIAKLRILRRQYSHGETLWDPYTIDRPLRKIDSRMPLQITAAGNITAEMEDPHRSLEPAELISELHVSLRSGNPHRVLEDILRQMKAIGSLEYARTVFATIPAATFSEILLILDPKHFMGEYAKIFQEIGSAWRAVLRLPPVNERGHHEFLVLFLRHISTILSSRQAIHPPTIYDYKYLLKCTRMAGDTSTAKFIWKKMHQAILESVAAAEVDPTLEVMTADVECYNHYVATLCWSEMSNLLQRRRLRIIPRNFIPRSWEQQQFPALQGHSVGSGGLKTTVASNFRMMVQQKVQPNEETFCLMLVSVARERDLASIASILKRVWGLDVDAILASDEVGNVPTKSFHPSDPLYPSNRLLMALAHAYSINNSIPTAIRLVDFVARQYSLTISRDVWSELLERTYMLAASRGRNPSEGQLPPAAVRNLWVTMTAKPYSIQPDFRMYNFLIGSLIRRQCYGEVQTEMANALERHRADVSELSNRILLFNGSNPVDTPRQVLTQRANDLSYQHLRVKLNRQYIRRWVRLLIWRGSKDMRQTDTFAYQGMPNIVKEWALFLPQISRYKTPSGVVFLHSDSGLLNRIRQEKYMRRNGKWINPKSQLSWAGQKRTANHFPASLGLAEGFRQKVAIDTKRRGGRRPRTRHASPTTVLERRSLKADGE